VRYGLELQILIRLILIFEVLQQKEINLFKGRVECVEDKRSR